MSFSRSVRWTPLVSAIALGLALAACTAGPAQEPATPTTPGASVRATPCGAIAEDIVDAIQRYVDSFATVAAGNLEGASTIGAEQLQTAADRLRRQAEVQGCSSAELTGLVRAELGRLHGGTAVQDAVADTFKADPLGTMNPSDAGAGEFEVNTADELVAAVSQAGSDSVIRLAAGSYDLAAPLIVHRPLTLTGAGPDGTTITSSAASATLLSVIDGDIQLRDLAVEHSGGLGAHVLMVTQGGYDLQRVRISGARVADGTGGFGIVLRPTRATLDSRPTSQRLTEVTLVDNSAGGLVVAGQQAPTIQMLSVTGTDGCGLCYVEDAAGKASDVTISNAAIGVRVNQQAARAHQPGQHRRAGRPRADGQRRSQGRRRPTVGRCHRCAGHRVGDARPGPRADLGPHRAGRPAVRDDDHHPRRHQRLGHGAGGGCGRRAGQRADHRRVGLDEWRRGGRLRRAGERVGVRAGVRRQAGGAG